MLRSNWIVVLTVWAPLPLVSSSQAATITFGSGGSTGFNGVGNLGHSISAGVGFGITLTITASGCATGPCIITSSSVGGFAAGFGFGVNSAGGATDGSGAPELNGPPEVLTLRFSSPIVLTGYILEDVDDGSDNGVIFSRTLPTSLTITSIQNLTDGGNPPGSIYDSGESRYTSEMLSVYGTEFTVSASSGEFIRLRALSFVEMPEPGAVWITGIGIAFLCMLWSRDRERRSLRNRASAAPPSRVIIDPCPFVWMEKPRS